MMSPTSGVYLPSALSSGSFTHLSHIADVEKVPFYDSSACVKEETAQVDSDAVNFEYPDGGLRAWLVVLGVASGLCATFGFVNAWGVFQAYYEQITLRNKSPSDIAWIGSMQYALVFMPGVVTGRLFDMGYLRAPVGCASALLILCTFLTGECKEFWQFLLCQGFGVGIASGVIFNAAVGTVPHWFHKKLGLALAAMATGSSVGGTIFPIMLKNLIERYSFQWTLRITGFVVAAFLLILNVTIARRLPPKLHSGPFFKYSLLKSKPYTVYTISLFVGFLGIYTCLTYLSLSGILVGIDTDVAFYLVSIANACSLFGRLGGGIMADRYGGINALIPPTIIAGIMTYVWPFAKTTASMVVVTVIYGISSGVFVAVMGTPVVQMGPVTEVGTRAGITFSIMSLGALAGPPISGAILNNTKSFENVGYYAGSAIMASVVLMFISRQLLLGGKGFIGHV
ncbi:MFS general substrate transporter [Trametes gibbosa]|nr:MFS general substrate transporter [Trametes gibbosa]